MDATEVPEGIDPKNACKIEVNVNSYFSTRDGKKVYNRGRTVSWVVDSEEYAVIDLEKDILGEKYFWDSGQKVNFWVLTGNNLTCKLTTDNQLLDLLRSSQLVKFLMIVGSRQEGDEMPAAVNMVAEDIPTLGDEEMKIEGFEWAAVPQYGETPAGPPMTEEEEKEHFMTFGCDPHGDESTGVDEEWRYFNNVDSAIPDAQPVDYMEVEVQKRKRTRPIPEFDTECVRDDEAAMVDDYLVPHTTHEKENLIIKEGDTFRDTFRKNKSESAEASKTVAEPCSPMLHPSPGVTTRRMASLSPTSPVVTTRRMAAVSPGGINRRLIIE